MLNYKVKVFLLSLLLDCAFAFPVELADDSDVLIDLSFLGPGLFGEPDKAVGERLESWTPEDGNPEELGSYLEGDILMPMNMKKDSVGRNGMIASSYRWNNREIPYIISGGFNDKERGLIYKAFNEYHTKTCVKFVPKTSQHSDYISIESDKSGCWSNVGKIGGKQVVNLQAPSCVSALGTVLHELYHAAGFMHEQNREDRDGFVSIMWNNIPDAVRNNFVKADSGSTSTFGVPYDYGSVMHYSGSSFSQNGNPTIKAKFPGGEKMGQRKGFSQNDLLKINKMYQCGGKSLAKRDVQVSDETDPEFNEIAFWKLSKRPFEETGHYYQGDIKFPPMRRGRNGISEKRWEDGVVPYTISKGFFGKYRRELMVALEAFEMVSCVRFIPRTTEEDYISIENNDDGCWSDTIGKMGGKQIVNLQMPGCHFHGSVVHELLHAVGFHHEQNREDRDEFVSIKFENIVDEDVSQFDKLEPGTSSTFGVPYDYGSVMHYSRFAFSKNEKPTIVPLKDVVGRMGQRNGFSAGDIKKLNKMYECQ